MCNSLTDQVIITSVTSAVDEKRSESSTNISEDETSDTEAREEADLADKMSSVTASSCCRCKLPITGEKERFISRVV